MKIKKTFKTIAFLLCVVFTFALLIALLTPKFVEHGTGWTCELYDSQKPEDVLLLGSSRIYNGCNPALMYDAEGVAAYAMASSAQPLYVSYYLLEDHLRTHQPDVVVMDLYAAFWQEETPDLLMIGVMGIRSPLLRICALMEDRSLPQAVMDSFVLPNVHQEYRNLDREHFVPVAHRNLGSHPNFKYKEQNNAGFSGELVFPEETEKMQQTYKYIEKTIQLCKEKDVPLVFTCLPFIENPERKGMVEALKNAIEQQDGTFLDCNTSQIYQEIGLDFSKDFADEIHLSYTGQSKYSLWLARWLKQNYPLEDHRGQPGYEMWEEAQKWRINRQLEADLEKAETPYQTLHALSQADRSALTILLTFRQDAAQRDNINNGIRDSLLALGVPEESIYQGGAYLIENNQVIYKSAAGTADCAAWIDGMSVLVQNKDLMQVQFDTQTYTHNKDAMLAVYDPTEKRILCQRECYLKFG